MGNKTKKWKPTVKAKWTEELTNELKALIAQNKNVVVIAEKLGLHVEQIKRRINTLNRIAEEKKAEEDAKKAGDKDNEISVVESARTTLGAEYKHGSYYLDGKRILVGEMILRARGGL